MINYSIQYQAETMHNSEQHSDQFELPGPPIRRSTPENTYNKYDFIQQNTQPIKQKLTTRYQPHHNEYLHNVLAGQIRCYEKHGRDPVQYYQCYGRVQAMVANNFKMLARETAVLNVKLDNCLHTCSVRSQKNEEFEECAKGPKGCFRRFGRKASAMYRTMYEAVLAEAKVHGGAQQKEVPK